MSLSLAGITTEIKCALWERKYRCDTKGKNIYMKFIKTKYNKSRRAAAAMEIEEALSDFAYEDEGDLLVAAYEDLHRCWAENYRDAEFYPEEDRDDFWFDDEDGYDECWDFEADYYDYCEEDEYDYEEGLESAFNGNWQEEVPEVFGDEFEAIVVAA